MNSYIEDLQWRYATKKFDASKKVSEKDLETLLEAVQLTASSYGLQPYHVFVITDIALRKKLQPVSWGQTQIVDSTYLIVLANKSEVDAEWIDAYLKNVSETRSIPLEALSEYREMMHGNLLNLSTAEKSKWSAKQTYIALGNLLSAAASLKIDTTPMEGFDSGAYNELLGLTEKGLNACVVAAIGYRSDDDLSQNYAKVRQSKKELFTHI